MIWPGPTARLLVSAKQPRYCEPTYCGSAMHWLFALFAHVAPPQSVSLSSPFLTPSPQLTQSACSEGAVALHMPLAQSASPPHFLVSTQGMPMLLHCGPPQSSTVST